MILVMPTTLCCKSVEVAEAYGWCVNLGTGALLLRYDGTKKDAL